MQGSRRRTERPTTSCTECQRRKQKCSQGHPCTNCTRRFPQPICEYKPRSYKGSKQPGAAAIARNFVELREGPYAHLPFPGIPEAISQVEDPNDYYASDSLGPQRAPSSSTEVQLINRPSYRNPWALFRTTKGFGVPEDSKLNPDLSIESILRIMGRRQRAAYRIVTDDPTIEDDDDFWSIERAVELSPSLERHEHAFQNLPMAATKLNKELVRTYLQLLSRFKVSVDGNPDPNNPYMRSWVPFSVQDPLLLQILLHSSACFFAETGRVPHTFPMVHMGRVIHMLNEKLNSEQGQVKDATILGVAQIVVHTWYWGETSALHAHMSGLKRMIRMRGGLSKLGMHGFLSKTILMGDAVMALSHEVEPDIFGHPGFEYNDPITMPFRIALNSPLIWEWPLFSSCADSLKLFPSTAMILDYMRSLIRKVVTMPIQPSEKELQELHTFANWVNNQIAEMPESITISSPSEQRRLSPNSSLGSDESSASSPDQKPASSKSSSPSARPWPSHNPYEHMYVSVRLTAKVYCRAILNRTPLSVACTEMDFLRIWGAAWNVTVSVWQKAVGIYIWVMMAVVPSCHKTQQARFIKTFVMSGFMAMSVESWHVAMEAVETGLQLQRWLARDARAKADSPDGGLTGSKEIVEKYGLPIKDYQPDFHVEEDL